MINSIKNSFLILTISFCFVFNSCTNPVEEETLPKGKTRLDLSPYGKKISLIVPDSTSGKLTVTENNTLIEINCINQQTKLNFGISIEETSGDIALIKNDIANDDVNRFKRFVEEDSTLLVWESEIVNPEFHLYSVAGNFGETYVIRDISSTETEPFNEQQIKVMAEAVKSIKILSAEKKNK